MHERGRPTADAGNEYHDVVTVHRLADMIRTPSVVDVTPEAHEPTDDIRTRIDDGSAIYEQVKERSPGVAWTAASLVSEGVIRQFLRQFRAGSARLRFVTGSDATPLIATTRRAASVLRNHPTDIDAGIQEWTARLGEGHSGFAADLRRLLNSQLVGASEPEVTVQDLAQLLGSIDVLDNQGRLDQIRERAQIAWASLVDDAPTAVEKLEKLARRHANERTAITRTHIEETIAEARLTPLFGAWAPFFDPAVYADMLDAAVARSDIAQLPPMTRSIASSGVSLFALPPRAHIQAGHGGGKTWLATRLATRMLREGNAALLIGLGAWTGDLNSLLLAELTTATGRSASESDLDALLRRPSTLVVFDSLDEVPVGQRDEAERHVAIFARRHPDVQIVVTSRPTLRPWSHLTWPAFDLAPLGDEQVQTALGRRSWNLPEGLRDLSRSPLLLGLLRQGFGPTEQGPTTEGEILDRAVTTLARRESGRTERPDFLTVLAVLEELSFEWLSAGRVVLTREQLREVAVATVDRVADRQRVHLQAPTVEVLVTDIGLAVPSGDLVRPAHRSLIDHLAGRAIPGRRPQDVIDKVELREAVGRFVGNASEVSPQLLDILDGATGDLELLARCRHLARPSLASPGDAVEFAHRYHQSLRSLASGQLRAVGTLSGPLRIVIAQNAGWIDDEPLDPSAEEDLVLVRKADGGGGNIVSLRHASSYGFSPRIKVPQLAAFDRVAAELERQMKDEDLLLEGPELTYERLSGYAREFDSVLHPMWRSAPADRPAIKHFTPNQLLAHFGGLVRTNDLDELRTGLVAWIREVNEILAAVGTEPAWHAPRDPKGQRSGLVVNGYPLVQLVLRARALGIADLPLHPLGLLPTSHDDPVLTLPERLHDLHGDPLLLFVERHEVLSAAATRQLIADNLSGIASLLPSSARRPRRHRVWVEDNSTAGRMDVDIRIAEEPADQDEWLVELGPPAVDRESLSRWADLFALAGPRKAAYRVIAREVRAILQGSNALGRQEL